MISNEKWPEVYSFLNFTASMSIQTVMAICERAMYHHDLQDKETPANKRRATNRAAFDRCMSVCSSAQMRASEMMLNLERYNSEQDISYLVELAQYVRLAKQVKSLRGRSSARLGEVDVPDDITLRDLHPTAAPWQTVSLFEASELSVR